MDLHACCMICDMDCMDMIYECYKCLLMIVICELVMMICDMDTAWMFMASIIIFLVQRTLALMNCHACVWLNKACLGGQWLFFTSAF